MFFFYTYLVWFLNRLCDFIGMYFTLTCFLSVKKLYMGFDKSFILFFLWHYYRSFLWISFYYIKITQNMKFLFLPDQLSSNLSRLKIAAYWCNQTMALLFNLKLKKKYLWLTEDFWFLKMIDKLLYLIIVFVLILFLIYFSFEKKLFYTFL